MHKACSHMIVPSPMDVCYLILLFFYVGVSILLHTSSLSSIFSRFSTQIHSRITRYAKHFQAKSPSIAKCISLISCHSSDSAAHSNYIQNMYIGLLHIYFFQMSNLKTILSVVATICILPLLIICTPIIILTFKLKIMWPNPMSQTLIEKKGRQVKYPKNLRMRLA